MKKYKLLKKDTKEYAGKTLYRIQATMEFGSINKGELGGYIEKEGNLSMDNNAWVSGDARVYGDARVFGDAWVFGDARVYGDARVSGDARVYGDARVFGDARVYGDARVSGDARVYGDAWVFGDAWVSGDARVSGKLQLLAGSFFFGVRYDKEEIKYHPIPDTNNELIYKGEAKFGEEETEDVTITVEGQSKTISRKSAIALGLLEE